MDVQSVVVEMNKPLNAKEAAAILRATGSIFLPNHKPGDGFPYDVGLLFNEEEGCITYRSGEHGMRLIFTPFRSKERVIKLEDRTARLEAFAAALCEGFPQLANVVSAPILKKAASCL